MINNPLDSKQGEWAYFQGKIVPISDANINIQTHALQYGTGAFGGIRGYWNQVDNQLRLFRLRDHYQRLLNSAKILFLDPHKDLDELVAITLELVAKNNWRQNTYIRPFIYKSALQLSPRLHDVENDFAIYTLPLDDYLDINNGLSLCVSSWLRINDNAIPTRAKAIGGYINSALAKSEAVLNGFDDAIFLDSQGHVSEGSAANLFIVRDNQLITTPSSASILEGITRRTIIEIASKELAINVTERSISRSELYIADEVFLCGTGVQVAWVKHIDHRCIGSGCIGAMTKRIQQLYFNIVMGALPAYQHWLSPVYPQS